MAILLEHDGKQPRIDPSAYVAPNAVICGDVTLGPDARILFGAVITAESGPVCIGERCVVMENAVLRATSRHSLSLGSRVLVGLHAHLTGCHVGDDVFLATGATVFNGAVIGDRSEIRINGVVHLRTVLPPDSLVPIAWVAVGDPAQVFPPEEHERIWTLQEPLNFPRTVFGLDRAPAGQTIMPELTARYARALDRYRQAKLIAQ